MSGPQLFRWLWQEMGAKVDLFNCNYCQWQHRDINLAERAAGAVPENKYLTEAQDAGGPHSKPTRRPPPFFFFYPGQPRGVPNKLVPFYGPGPRAAKQADRAAQTAS